MFPVSTMPRLDRAFELAFDVREYAPGEEFPLADCRLTLHELRHSAPNCGVRVTAAGSRRRPAYGTSSSPTTSPSTDAWLTARHADAIRVYDGPVDIAVPGATSDVPLRTG